MQIEIAKGMQHCFHFICFDWVLSVFGCLHIMARHLTLFVSCFAVEPTVIIQQCASPLTEGANTTLYCNVTGNPTPSVAWIRKETNKIASSNNVLHITDVQRNQSGDYECLAWNGIGDNSTNSCFVDVQCKHCFIFMKKQSYQGLLNKQSFKLLSPYTQTVRSAFLSAVILGFKRVNVVNPFNYF